MKNQRGCDARAKSGRENERVDPTPLPSPSSTLNVSINPEGVYANEPFNHPPFQRRGRQKSRRWPVPQTGVFALGYESRKIAYCRDVEKSSLVKPRQAGAQTGRNEKQAL